MAQAKQRGRKKCLVTLPSKRIKCSSASEAFNDLYLNERTADVFFTFEGSTERIPAHKAILSFNSSVFDQIFFGPSAVSGDILVARHSPEAFKDFLQFFYLNEITLKTPTIVEVIRLSWAHDLPVKHLEMCGRFSLDHSNCKNIDDICLTYKLALLFQSKKIQTLCEHEISIHCGKLFETNDFVSCSFDVLGHILDLDKLLCDESLVLRACLDWARYKCERNGKDKTDVENLREYLIDSSNGINLLHKIRYSSISRDEFSIHLNILDKLFPDASEREDVMLLLLGSKENLKTGKFSTKPRNDVIWNDATDCMFVENDIYSILPATKRFNHVLVLSQAILLGGLYIVPLISRAPDVAFLCVHLSIVEQQNDGRDAGNVVSKLIHKECQKVPERMEKLYMPLKPNPILMKPDCEYHIEIDLKLDRRTYLHLGDDAPYGSNDGTDVGSGDGIDYDSDDGIDYDSDDTNDLDERAHPISFYDEVEYNQKIDINDGLTVQSHPKSTYCTQLIKGFKFIQ